MYKPVVLIILDGWGLSENLRGNAILEAKLPTIDKLNKFYPQVALQACGISVGLPWGEPGNSEVGHITLGTGKVIYQNMPRITMSIQSGEFFQNPSLLKAIENAKKNNSALHLMGLLGKGGIHSNVDHLYALVELAKNNNISKLFIHVFTDGRDSSPTSGIESVKELEKKLEEYGIGKIASISGRYFSMDRNNNWDRTQKAYESIVEGQGESITSAVDYLQKSYAKEIFDEYVEPAVVCDSGKPIGKIADGDSVIFFNFREDRARQLTKAFVLPGFSKFKRNQLTNLVFATMVQYEEDLPVEVAYRPIEIKNCLGEILSQKNISQLRIAETEKFAHVTYFFNGGNEEPFSKEDRIIVPSKAVSIFSEAPEMSAQEITNKVCESVEMKKYDFILINFANADIVGHTGNEKATISAVETIDRCLEKLIPTVISHGGCLLITADHGNAEELINLRNGETDTEHSANPVPLWFVTADNHCDAAGKCFTMRVAGLLSDVAPTVLDLMGIDKPADMTGESLLPMLK
jgi:2,3-bisphosphoglycerate-independent phosphoglycerate mutase